MTVGVDLRIFQIGHQYRGIGAHITNMFREFSEMKDLPNFVFYEHPNVESGLKIIAEFLPKLKYEVRYTDIRLIGETYYEREWVSFKNRYLKGDAGLGDLTDIDVLLSVDFNLGVPRPSKVKTVLISYDMIPWVLSKNYLPNFIQSLKKTKDPRRALKAQLDKRLYFQKFKQANKRANKILAISEHTKKDIIKYLHIKPEKIKAVLLGIDVNQGHKKYKNSISCLDVDGKQMIINLKTTNYVFFMGGADRRRKIEDLVGAFNDISNKKEGLKLILAGYDFKSYETLPDAITKLSIEESKFKDSIFFAGFTTEEEKNSLFTNAIAFVFPSIYEGFGLPILEAMDLDCPVITYDNSSISEVAGDAVIYASNSTSIAEGIKSLLENPKIRDGLLKNGQKQIKLFSWKNTATKTLHALENN